MIQIQKLVSILILVFTFLYSCAQDKTKVNQDHNLKDQITTLAADDMEGRETGKKGNRKAAQYIEAQFLKAGAKLLPNQTSMQQNIPFIQSKNGKGFIDLGFKKLTQGEDVVFMSGSETLSESKIFFVGHGAKSDDYLDKGIKDKIAVAILGSEEMNDARQSMSLSQQKVKWAKNIGAKGLIEIYTANMPWKMLASFMNRERLAVENKDSKGFLHAMIDLPKTEGINTPSDLHQKTIKIEYSGNLETPISASNVVAYTTGTDPKLKNEYIMLSAHFDHIGIKKGVASGKDSIYNGARDNAIGTAALLAAAAYFKNNPPKRSIIYAAWDAEEKGLLGSKYFADNPLVSLKDIKFNLNIDNAGYNDTTIVSVMGMNRTGATEEIIEASAAFGLTAISDPAPEQNLFDRSDNVNFAAKGIPSPTFSMGFRDFNQEISKYYHQLEDHTESLNWAYIYKYINAYIFAAEKIANKQTAPKWSKEDKYEAAAKELYGDKYE